MYLNCCIPASGHGNIIRQTCITVKYQILKQIFSFEIEIQLKYRNIGNFTNTLTLLISEIPIS